MGRFADARVIAELGAALSTDPSRDVRWRAARSMGQIRDPKAIPFLEAGLKDVDSLVRARTVQALAAFPMQVVRPFLESAQNDPDETVRSEASRLLETNIP